MFFVHVPKTAGTSFRRFLERASRRSGGSPAPVVDDTYPTFEEFVSGGREFYGRYDFGASHVTYAVARLLPVRTRFITVLRDPMERCLSHIKHQMSLEIEFQGSQITDPSEFILEPRNRFFLDTIRNNYVKYFSYSGDPNDRVDDAQLSVPTAIACASRCFVGWADDLESFQLRVAIELLGASPIVAAGAMDEPPMNRSDIPRGASSLSSEAAQTLRSLNAMDEEFYLSMRAREHRPRVRLLN